MAAGGASAEMNIGLVGRVCLLVSGVFHTEPQCISMHAGFKLSQPKWLEQTKCLFGEAAALSYFSNFGLNSVL